MFAFNDLFWWSHLYKINHHHSHNLCRDPHQALVRALVAHLQTALLFWHDA